MQDKLIKIFELLCDDFTKLLSERETMNSSDRKLIMEFLKDNNITCNGMVNKNVKNIVESLPFDENVEHKRAINQ